MKILVTGGNRVGQICSIGANAFIRDITIKDNVTVGASSCVVKDIKSDCVIAGIPARIIHTLATLYDLLNKEKRVF